MCFFLPDQLNIRKILTKTTKHRVIEIEKKIILMQTRFANIFSFKFATLCLKLCDIITTIETPCYKFNFLCCNGI